MPSETKKAIDDLLSAISNKEVWMALGWIDVRKRYHRSKLGVLWAGLSVLIFVSALSPIYSSFMGADLKTYAIHLYFGFITWNYISNIMMECSREFINSSTYLVSFRISYFTLLFRVVWRNTVVYGYQLIAFIPLLLILKHPPSAIWLITIPALLLIALNALWLGLIMSILTTRFRDVGEIVNNIIRLVFFATPIMWTVKPGDPLYSVAELNPFYHLIELIRSPLLHNQVSGDNWLWSITLVIVGFSISFPFFIKYRKHIPFWV